MYTQIICSNIRWAHTRCTAHDVVFGSPNCQPLVLPDRRDEVVQKPLSQEVDGGRGTRADFAVWLHTYFWFFVFAYISLHRMCLIFVVFLWKNVNRSIQSTLSHLLFEFVFLPFSLLCPPTCHWATQSRRSVAVCWSMKVACVAAYEAPSPPPSYPCFLKHDPWNRKIMKSSFWGLTATYWVRISEIRPQKPEF